MKIKALTLWLTALFACIVFPCAAFAATVSSITIDGLHSITREEFLDLFALRPGDPYTERLVRDGIKRAFLKGIFDDIVIETDGDEHASIRITVLERDFIRSIRIAGDAAVSKKRIRRELDIQTGGPVRDDLLRRSEVNLKAKLARIGYPEASVSIMATPSGKRNRPDIVVTVDAGRPLIITSVKSAVNGSPYLERIKLGQGDIFDQEKLDTEMKRLKDYLKKAGYYNPTVGPYEFHDGALTITIETGKKLSLRFDGNHALSSKRLLKEAVFFEFEMFNDDVIGETVDKMLALYHEKGYAFAQIAPVIEEKEHEFNLSYFVHEGEKFTVGKVDLHGSSFPPHALQRVMALREKEPYNPDRLVSDRDSVVNFYHALGYLEVSVDPIKADVQREFKTATVEISVSEGKQTVIDSLLFDASDEMKKDDLLKVAGIKVGDPYNEVDISDARFRLLNYFDSAGYPQIDIRVKRSIENHRADLVFEIVERDKSYFGKTIIVGNEKTQYHVIRRELAHQENTPYSFRTVGEERQRLYRMGLFSDVEIEAIDTDETKRDLLIRVKEGNAGSVEFGIGYADYEQLRGFFEVAYRNLFGLNKTILARTELSSIEKRFMLQYYDPWFLGYRIPFRAIALYEDRTEIAIPSRDVRYRTEKYSISVGTDKQLTDRIKGELFYELSQVNTYDVEPDVILSKEDVGTVLISSIRPSITYDSRDNPFEPTRGIVAGISSKFALPILFTQSNFVKISIYGSIFKKVHERAVLALSMRGGVAYGFSGTTELPIVERFFLGGRSSVRGYEQDTLGPKGSDGNPTGGNAFFMGSAELRTYVGRGFSLVPFFDFGNVWVKASDFKADDMKYTAGMGLRYHTPVGPIRVDWGFKLNRDSGESSNEIHFSIGHAF